MAVDAKSVQERCIARFVSSAIALTAQLALALNACAKRKKLDLGDPTFQRFENLSMEFAREQAHIATLFPDKLAAAIHAQFDRVWGRSEWKSELSLSGGLELMDDTAMLRDLSAVRIARRLDEQVAPERAQYLRYLAALFQIEELQAERDPFRPRVLIDVLFETVAESRLSLVAKADFSHFLNAEFFGDVAQPYRDLLDQCKAEGLDPEAEKKARLAASTSSASTPAASVRAPSEPAGTDPTAAKRFDLLAAAFDELFASPAIAMACKRELGRLQTPALHVAMTDPHFFSEQSHPARLLLERTVRMAAEQTLGTEGGPALAMQLEPIIDQVLARYRQDPQCFAHALVELERLNGRRLAQLSAAVAGRATEVEQQERDEATERLASQMTLELLAEHQAPVFLAEFALDHWRYTVRDRMLLYGEDSSAVERSRTLLLMLLASVRAPTSEQERADLEQHRPALSEWIEKIFNTTQAPATVRERFLANLAQAQQAVADGTPLEAEDGEEFARTDVEIPAFQKTTVMPRPGVENNPSFGTQTPFTLGTWLDSDGPEPGFGRSRIAWISPRGAHYVLLSEDGKGTEVCSYAQISDAVEEGRLRPVPLFNPIQKAMQRSAGA